jgi:hypothetical protein
MLDSRPSATIPRDSQPKQRLRKFHDGISNRTRSKADHIDQNIGNRTRSKVHVVCTESIQVNSFPLYDPTDFQIQSNVNEVV